VEMITLARFTIASSDAGSSASATSLGKSAGAPISAQTSSSLPALRAATAQARSPPTP
jgi:hypothetical protein